MEDVQKHSFNELMNVAFDVPLTLLYTSLSVRFDFSQIIYMTYGQAGKQCTNLHQDIS